MAVDLYVQHRDPDGQIPHQEFRSRGRDRVERETFGRDEPARDAEPSDRAFAHSEAGPVELTERERAFGVYVLGKTGSGKSVLITNAALLDIEANKALIFPDPHGDAARSLLDRKLSLTTLFEGKAGSSRARIERVALKGRGWPPS